MHRNQHVSASSEPCSGSTNSTTPASKEELLAELQRLRHSEQRYRMIVEQNDDILFDWDFQTDTIEFSSKYERVFGYSPLTENLSTNASIRERIHPADHPAFEDWIQNTYQKPGCSETQYRIKQVDGSYIWMRSRSTAICDENGLPLRAIGVFNNINVQKKELDTLKIKSQRDPLTKLLNKEETQLRIDQWTREFPDSSGALLIVDIDNFKGINDHLGHQLGDTVLTETATKMQELFRESDIIGRIGGDEMIVFMRDCDKTAVTQKAAQLSLLMRATYYGSSTQYNVSGSIGIALFPQHGRRFDVLYQLADMALYQSKGAGKDCFTLYNEGMSGFSKGNRTPVEWTDQFLKTYFQNDFPFKVFEMLYETKDVHATTQRIVEFLGNEYKTDRVYVFLKEHEGDTFRCAAEWHTAQAPPLRALSQTVSADLLKVYFDKYNDEGMFICPITENAFPAACALGMAQDVKSMLHCTLYDDGVLYGFIGFDMCCEYRHWSGEEIAMIGYISRILSVFLNKTATETKLRANYTNYVTMLNNLNGFVYVIDPKTYTALYINKATEALGCALGDCCYEVAFDLKAPCENCPLELMTENVNYATTEMFSKKLQSWVQSAASRLKWEDGRDAILICCTDISKYKK